MCHENGLKIVLIVVMVLADQVPQEKFECRSSREPTLFY